MNRYFLFLWLACETLAHAATFTVDRLDDSASATACDDATANDCSLRGAIVSANPYRAKPWPA